MKRTLLVFLIIFPLSTSLAFAWGWGDLCEKAKETPMMTNVQLKKFYNDEIKGNSFSGKGIVRDVRPYYDKYVVVVDCLNDVLANVIVSTSSAEELKTGQEVTFSGKSINVFRRYYRDIQRLYQVYELESGDIQL